MSSFAKALKHLDALSEEIRALSKQYDNPQLTAFLKAIGGSSRTMRASRGVSAAGKPARYAADFLSTLVKATQEKAKAESLTVNGLKDAASVTTKVAKGVLEGSTLGTRPRAPAIRALCKWTGVAVPAETSDGASVITPPSGAKRKGKKK